jgi:hypothetical protein
MSCPFYTCMYHAVLNRPGLFQHLLYEISKEYRFSSGRIDQAIFPPDGMHWHVILNSHTTSW